MELTWKQFREQNTINILTESEQIRQYYLYLDSVSNQLMKQNKGPRTTETRITPPYSGYILQEDFKFLLQEDGSKIYL